MDELQRCVEQWQDFEELRERCAARLQDITGRVQRIELQSTVAEKEQMLDRIKVTIIIIIIYI